MVDFEYSEPILQLASVLSLSPIIQFSILACQCTWFCSLGGHSSRAISLYWDGNILSFTLSITPSLQHTDSSWLYFPGHSLFPVLLWLLSKCPSIHLHSAALKTPSIPTILCISSLQFYQNSFNTKFNIVNRKDAGLLSKILISTTNIFSKSGLTESNMNFRIWLHNFWCCMCKISKNGHELADHLFPSFFLLQKCKYHCRHNSAISAKNIYCPGKCVVDLNHVIDWLTGVKRMLVVVPHWWSFWACNADHSSIFPLHQSTYLQFNFKSTAKNYAHQVPTAKA